MQLVCPKRDVTPPPLDAALDQMRIMPKRIYTLSLAIALCLSAITCVHAQEATTSAADYKTDTDVLYRGGDDTTEYMRERCRLDVYTPASTKGFPTVVWFHGGGLKGGNKSIPKELKEQGIAEIFQPGASLRAISAWLESALDAQIDE